MSASLYELLPSPREIRAERARRSLLRFTLDTMPDYQAGWHHRLLCERLDRFARGEVRRFIVSMPPQHGKSELVSRRLPAYLLGRNPDTRVIACSYAADLASRNNRDVQRIIDSPAYRTVFPGTGLSGTNVRTVAQGSWLRNGDLFEVVGRRGSYRSAGVGGGITGMGADWIIVDDPVKNREEADSPTVRQSIWQWYTSTVYSRRSGTAGILVCMTRWNEDDLVGRLLKLQADDPRADRWEVLTLPAILEESAAGDPRRPGEALWPERYPVEELAKTRANSAYEWAALYQQQPRPEGGTEWPESYFGPQIWFEDWPQHLTLRTIALDPSKGRGAKWGDYSAYVRLGRDDKGVLWCEADLSNQRQAEQIVADGIEHHRQFGADVFVVEANVFQELFVVIFRQQSAAEGIMIPVAPVVSVGDKKVRIRRLGPDMQAGNIRVRRTRGTQLLVRQLREFPLCAHDDGPDALEMALRAMIDLHNGRRQQRPGRLRP